MISPQDWQHLEPVPDGAKPLAMWLWLNLDPMGRGPAEPEWIASAMHPTVPVPTAADVVLEQLLTLIDVGFLTTYRAEGREWLLLLHPLKVDLRRTKIHTPEPPEDRPWTSVAVGGGLRGRDARAGDWARERARERVRVEDAARADAWAAVREPVAEGAVPPSRPFVLDAPPMFCDEHMPHGAGRKKCGPCRDSRLLRDEWMQRKVYEERLTEHYEEHPDDEPW